MGRGARAQGAEEERVRGKDPRSVQISGLCPYRIRLGAERRGSGSALRADQGRVPVRFHANYHRRDEPLRGKPSLRGAADLLYHSGFDPATVFRGLHRWTDAVTLFARTIPDESDSEAVRVPWNAD